MAQQQLPTSYSTFVSEPTFESEQDECQRHSSLVEDNESLLREDSAKLRRVPDQVPASAWLIIIAEICERFAFFGILGPLQNYIQNPKNDPLRPGGIGLGQGYATGLNQVFTFWCYATPIASAIAADHHFGRLKTIVYSCLIYTIGLAVLSISSWSTTDDYRVSLGGLLVAMALIGIGTGGIKPNVGPLIAEQYARPKESIHQFKDGEMVVLDYDLTIQRIFMSFYFWINIGSLSSIATTEIEKNYGFGPTFLLPLLVFFVGFSIYLASMRHCRSQPPTGSVVLHAFQVLWIAAKNKGNLHAARPSSQRAESSVPLPWEDHFVDEIHATLVACKVFLFLPFYWLAYSQMLTNFISQAGTMETHGVPNDIMANIDPITVIILVPILDRMIYPILGRLKISFPPLIRITWGFMLCGLAMAYAAVIQHLIYLAPPCFEHPRSQDCMDGKLPNQIHVALQTPAYILIALSELFAVTSGYEIAFANAPASMKSFVTALFLSTAAAGSIMAIIIAPLTVDPKVLWMYVALSVQTIVVGVVFWRVCT